MQFCEWEASVAGQEEHEPHATIIFEAFRQEPGGADAAREMDQL